MHCRAMLASHARLAGFQPARLACDAFLPPPAAHGLAAVYCVAKRCRRGAEAPLRAEGPPRPSNYKQDTRHAKQEGSGDLHH